MDWQENNSTENRFLMSFSSFLEDLLRSINIFTLIVLLLLSSVTLLDLEGGSSMKEDLEIWRFILGLVLTLEILQTDFSDGAEGM